MNRIGGVNRDISDPDAIVAELRAIGRLVERDIVPSLMESRTAMARMRGVGVLTLGQAIDRGVVGPVARASSVWHRRAYRIALRAGGASRDRFPPRRHRSREPGPVNSEADVAALVSAVRNIAAAHL